MPEAFTYIIVPGNPKQLCRTRHWSVAAALRSLEENARKIAKDMRTPAATESWNLVAQQINNAAQDAQHGKLGTFGIGVPGGEVWCMESMEDDEDEEDDEEILQL